MARWTVGAARDLRIVAGSWDGPAAARAIFEWAGGDEFDPAKARRGFLIYDADEPTLRGSYKLPFARVEDGELVAVDGGLRAAASRLPQTDAPQEVLDRARSVLDAYFARMEDDGKRTGRRGLEWKASSSFVKSISDRTVTGIASVFGNIDDGNDIIWPGAFAKTLRERARRIRHLWNHDAWEPPIAVVRSIREVGRDELPEQVLQTAPEALGGLEVTREYLDTPRGNEVLAGITAGAINEMSFMFEVIKADFGQLGDRAIRNIREVGLWETSDVLWGMNGATTAAKAARDELLLRGLDDLLRQLKAGARHSAADVALLQTIHDSAVELGAMCEPPGDDDETDESGTGAASLALPAALLQRRLRAAGLALALRKQ